MSLKGDFGMAPSIPYGVLTSDAFVLIVQILVIIDLGVSWTNEKKNISSFEIATLFLVAASLALTIMSTYLTIFPTKYFQYTTILLRLLCGALLVASHVHFAFESDATDQEKIERSDVYKGETIPAWPMALIGATVLSLVSSIALLTEPTEAHRLRKALRFVSKRTSKARRKIKKDLVGRKDKDGNIQYSRARKSLSRRAGRRSSRAKVAPASSRRTSRSPVSSRRMFT